MLRSRLKGNGLGPIATDCRTFRVLPPESATAVAEMTSRAVLAAVLIGKTLIFLVFPSLLAPQTVSVGVKVGAHLTGDLDEGWAQSESKRYTAGPMASMQLPAGFRVEAAALYRRAGYRTSSGDILGGTYAERDWGNSWEFPLVLRHGLWRALYAGAGYAPRWISGKAHQNAVTVIDSLGTRRYSESAIPASWDTTHGVIAAAGVEKRWGRARIAPEIRYVRWNRPAVDRSGSHGFSIVSAQNQVDLLVGITFP